MERILVSLANPLNKKPRKQSAVIPYFYDDKGNLRIMLIKSKHKNNWGVPKGAIEPHLTVKQSAKLEALEEAGLKGKVTHKLGEYKYVKGSTGRRQKVRIFGMLVKKVKNNYLEAEWRTRKDFSAKKALTKLNKDQRVFLKQLIDTLEVENNESTRK